jgi:DNA (cytosine-5)-methyltransferase 1
MGYYRAGFDVVGVDINPQPRYPFEFVQGDALEYCAAHGTEFDVIHASPPCQAHTRINHARKAKTSSLVSLTRDEVVLSGKPYIIENVQGAPLCDAAMLCGTMFGLNVIRHRLFECNWLLLAPGLCNHLGTVADGTYAGVHGGGPRTTHNIPYAVQRARWESAMGIDWMRSRYELSQAIPPAYTEYIGRQLMAALENLK